MKTCSGTCAQRDGHLVSKVSFPQFPIRETSPSRVFLKSRGHTRRAPSSSLDRVFASRLVYDTLSKSQRTLSDTLNSPSMLKCSDLDRSDRAYRGASDASSLFTCAVARLLSRHQCICSRERERERERAPVSPAASHTHQPCLSRSQVWVQYPEFAARASLPCPLRTAWLSEPNAASDILRGAAVE